MSATNALESFRSQYTPRNPKAGRIRSRSEVAKVESDLLGTAPTSTAPLGVPPESRQDSREGCHLWVIDERGVPYVLEQPMAECGGALPKHTNLTGGNTAWIGGEVWFENPSSLYVSGGSGRYPPESAEQLEAAVDVFRAHSYTVRSLGWDDETGSPRRFLSNESAELAP